MMFGYIYTDIAIFKTVDNLMPCFHISLSSIRHFLEHTVLNNMKQLHIIIKLLKSSIFSFHVLFSQFTDASTVVR